MFPSVTTHEIQLHVSEPESDPEHQRLQQDVSVW